VSSVAAHADELRALHVPGKPLVLPNAWSASSARAVAGAGFPVVATSSAAVNKALCFADDGSAPPREVTTALAAIANAVDVPMTADVEDGYGLAAHELADMLAVAGAAGCNLEDSDHRTGGLVPAHVHAERIAALKHAGRAFGVDLVVNARIDVFLRGLDPAEARYRAHVYHEAGADCVYPIMIPEQEIGEFVAFAAGPVNVLARVDAPRLRELAALGVARISFGAGLASAGEPLDTLLSRIADEKEDAWSRPAFRSSSSLASR
jgi:2-methylisocitrate lyase-like PEP mutase family enzyme